MSMATSIGSSGSARTLMGIRSSPGRLPHRSDDSDVGCPAWILWAGSGALAHWYDALAIWRGWADDVTGHEVDSGHFMTGESPEQTLADLLDFHGAPRGDEMQSDDRCAAGRSPRA
jgi:hypothetical protein